MIDTAKIEKAVKQIMEAIGEDLNRPGLQETPARTAKMYAEMFEGMQYTNQEIASMFSKDFEITASTDWVVMKNISIFSFCEHHFALMYNMVAHIAYKPNGRVIGLSKIARIAGMVAKRLQLQERIAQDIMQVLGMVLHTQDIMVVVEGEHSCMTARGVRANGAQAHTCTSGGIFESNAAIRQEILQRIQG